jgi:hypothetical protein
MTTWRMVHVFAGMMIVLSLALGVQSSPVFLSEWWLALTLFVGLN